MNRRMAFLLNPKDLDALREKIPEKLSEPFYKFVGFPCFSTLSGVPVYAHKRQPEGEAMEGPEEEIRRIIKKWQTDEGPK